MSCAPRFHGVRLAVCSVIPWNSVVDVLPFPGLSVPLGTGAASFFGFVLTFPLGGCLVLLMMVICFRLSASSGFFALPCVRFAWLGLSFCAILCSLHSVGFGGASFVWLDWMLGSLRSPSVLILLVLADLDG